jgi:hypothetical protein
MSIKKSKAPIDSKLSTKMEMQHYLKQINVHFTTRMKKEQLWNLIVQHSKTESFPTKTTKAESFSTTIKKKLQTSGKAKDCNEIIDKVSLMYRGTLYDKSDIYKYVKTVLTTSHEQLAHNLTLQVLDQLASESKVSKKVITERLQTIFNYEVKQLYMKHSKPTFDQKERCLERIVSKAKGIGYEHPEFLDEITNWLARKLKEPFPLRINKCS